MGNLVQMPFSHVVNLLEALERCGVPGHLVLRYRMDPEFAIKATQVLIAEHRENPGERCVIEIDRSLTRLQLSHALLKSCGCTLKDEIILALEPKRIFPDAGQQFFAHGAKPIEKIETFLVQLHKRTNEEEAVAILADMGLESVETEEALTRALYPRWWWSIAKHGAVVLDAKYKRPAPEGEQPKTEFLSFGVAIGGNSLVKLYDFADFSPSTQFLVKKINPQPKKEEEEE